MSSGRPIERDFPALFLAADRYAVRWQRIYLWLERIQLVALTLAAASSAVDGAGWRLTAVVLIVVAFLAQLARATTRADRKWWHGRAAAESAKTIAWRYSVGGVPFAINAPASDELLAERLGTIGAEFATVAGISCDGPLATDAMRSLRSDPLPDRGATYLDDRIRAQRDWYSARSRTNARMSGLWTAVALMLQGLALVIAAVTLDTGSWAIGGWEHIKFSHVGVLTSAVAAVVAWVAVKQHESLRQSYAVAANELSEIGARLQGADHEEAEWSRFVGRAEEAISREHTSWIARRRS